MGRGGEKLPLFNQRWARDECQEQLRTWLGCLISDCFMFGHRSCLPNFVKIVLPRALAEKPSMEKKADNTFCQAVKQPLRDSTLIIFFERKRESCFNYYPESLT